MRIHLRIYFTFVVLALFLSTTGFFCNNFSTNALELQKNEPVGVPLKEGWNVVLDPGNITVEFSKIEQDSRCPEDVRCVVPGEAEITLTIQRARGRSETRRVRIPGMVQTPYRGSSFELDGYRFTILKLDPYPRLDNKEEDRTYVASLEIERL